MTRGRSTCTPFSIEESKRQAFASVPDALLTPVRRQSTSILDSVNVLPSDNHFERSLSSRQPWGTKDAVMENNIIIPFLIAMMLLTGVCNTLLTKYQVSKAWRYRHQYKNRRADDSRIFNALVIVMPETQVRSGGSRSQSSKRITILP